MFEEVDYALDKVRTFAKVNKGSSFEEQTEKIDFLSESADLSTDAFNYAIEQITEHFGKYSGFVVVGLLIGLFIKQHQEEHAS